MSLQQNDNVTYKAASFVRAGTGGTRFYYKRWHYVGLFPVDQNGKTIIPLRMRRRMPDEKCKDWITEELNAFNNKNYEKRLVEIRGLVKRYNNNEISWENLKREFSARSA